MIYWLRGGGYNIVKFIATVYGRTKSHWFLNDYAVLMLFAPILNRGLEGIGKRELAATVLPLVLLAFGWSWMAVKFQRFFALPCVSGFGSYTFLMMIGVYVVARLCRILEVERSLRLWTVGLIFVASGVLVSVGGGHYASPFATIFAGSLFFLFKRLEGWLTKVGRIWTWCAPSMFAVYLLHAEKEGMEFIKACEQFFVDSWGLSVPVFFLLTAGLMFAGGIAIDMCIRRLAEFGGKRIINGRN